MEVYPVFLTGLQTRRCMVLGGGVEAERKVRGLLDAHAAVTVISTEVTDQLRRWSETAAIKWLPRDYETGDLQGAFLVIACGHEPDMNRRIWAEAHATGALINVVDDVTHSNFIAGSIVRQGALILAISTSGCAPALAVRLRERFEREFGPEYAAFLDLMRELRAALAASDADFQARRARWYRLIDSDILELLREGQTDQARQRARTIIGSDPSSLS